MNSRVTGTVTEVRTDYSVRINHRYARIAMVRCPFPRGEVILKSIRLWNIVPAVGDTVDVLYDPMDESRYVIDFSWERSLNYDGETGPYVQYTHTRCCSVLRKAAEVELPEYDVNGLADDEAQHLLRLLSRFPDVVKEAADKYEPSMITRAVTEIAQGYNKFYYEHRVLDAEPGVAAARVALTKAVKDVIKTGLWLIGIEAPERM